MKASGSFVICWTALHETNFSSPQHQRKRAENPRPRGADERVDRRHLPTTWMASSFRAIDISYSITIISSSACAASPTLPWAAAPLQHGLAGGPLCVIWEPSVSRQIRPASSALPSRSGVRRRLIVIFFLFHLVR